MHYAIYLVITRTLAFSFALAPNERSQVHVKYMPPLREIDHSTLVSLHGVTNRIKYTVCENPRLREFALLTQQPTFG